MQDLEHYISHNYSKTAAVDLAHALSHKPEKISELLQIIYREEEPVSRIAAWYLSTLFDYYPQLVYPYVDEMVGQVITLKSPAVIRALLRSISRSKRIKEEHHGILIQYTADSILSSKTEVAVQLFSLEIFFQIAKIQPELFFELENMIDLIYSEASKGIRNKCRNLLKQIDQIRSRQRH